MLNTRSTTVPHDEKFYYNWLTGLTNNNPRRTNKLLKLLRRNNSYDKIDLKAKHFTGDVLWLVAWLYSVASWPDGKQQVLAYLDLTAAASDRAAAG